MAADALEDELFELFGKLLFQSHQGLRYKYEVSCKELDFMVDFAKTQSGVLGARMMGGGFGGCTINFVHKDVVGTYVDAISKAYKAQFDIDLTPIETGISDGAQILK